jgi:hypothetical protein
VAACEAELHPDNQRAKRALPGSHADREACLELGDLAGDPGRIEHRLDALEQAHRDPAAPRRATAVCSGVGSRCETRSPRRWEQVIPAASMKARSPIAEAIATR